MLTILADMQLTRRKRVNIVVNTDGEPQFSASRIGDVLDWLRERDQATVNLETEDGHTYRLNLLLTKPLLSGLLQKPKSSKA